MHGSELGFPLELLRDLFEALGDYGATLRLAFHVPAGTAAGDPRLLEAFGVVADECGVYQVLAWATAELAGVVVQVYCHGHESPEVL